MTDKQILRTKLLTARQGMDGADVKNFSEKIVGQVLETVEWPKIRSLHTYLPLGNEVNTHLLLRNVWQKYPLIKIASWQKFGDGYRAFWLKDNDFGDRVPEGFKFGLIIVPALGFNSENFRLGRGGGFYDRFLAAQPQARTIGLCYESGRRSFTPETHDMPLEIIVTECAKSILIP